LILYSFFVVVVVVVCHVTMYYPQSQQPGYVAPPYPPPNMGMSGFMAPPPPTMVPQGMYPVSMGGQSQGSSPYPPQQQQQRSPYPSQSPPMAPQQQNPPPPPAKSRANPDTMPIAQIDNLSDAQVEEMLADEAKLTEFVKTLPYVQDYMMREESVRRLQADVDALLSRSSGNPEIDAKRRELNQKRGEFQAKSDQKRQKEGELTQNALYEKLDAAAKVVDNECEEIAAKLLSGDMTAQQFAKAYQEKRVLFHTRSAKKEAILHSM